MNDLCNSYKTELFFDNIHLKTLAEISDTVSTQSSSAVQCREVWREILLLRCMLDCSSILGNAFLADRISTVMSFCFRL